ncbi:General secretion pathway protein D [uncultured Candidatus Thioglobus sp.]|nr:General secretion pathway protein D [uncultured Candidatus Thioglobus sp.]
MQGEIIVGQEVPFITSRETNTDSKLFQNLERKDVGLKLKVKPQINNNGNITLSIEQEMSYLLPSSNASDVITSKRKIKTTVIVNNNQLLILGGLIDDSERDTGMSVPLLSDVPIFGDLFKQTNKTKEKRNLLIFLRPTILSDEIIDNIGTNNIKNINSILPSENLFEKVN